jgi:hypothetical protein
VAVQHDLYCPCGYLLSPWVGDKPNRLKQERGKKVNLNVMREGEAAALIDKSLDFPFAADFSS